MSLLKSIKGTLKNVQDDFSEGLKTISGGTEKPQIQQRVHHVQQAVNFDAGGELLHRNEQIWKDLYTYTEDTAKRAQDLDVDIAKLLLRYEKQSEVLKRLHQESANLPMLLGQLQDITNSLALVEEEYDKVEAGLVHLENLCEELDYQREEKSHHNQLAVYKMKKDHEIQKYKVQLAREHASKVQQIEKKRETLLKERQSAYEEQFSSDVDFYKKHGKIERLPSTPETQKKLDIADVQIEEDQSALDDFLASSASDLNLADQGDDTAAKQPSDDDEANSQVIPVATSPTPVQSAEVISPTSEESTEVTSLSNDDSAVTSPGNDDSAVTSPSNDESDGMTSPESSNSVEVISPTSDDSSELSKTETNNSTNENESETEKGET